MSIRFTTFLEKEYQRRSTRNPSYSKRAFAKDIGISKSCLHDIFSGRRQASELTISRVSKHFKLNTRDRQNLFSEEFPAQLINSIDYSDILHWEHLAVLNLIETKNSKTVPSWFAKELQISLAKAKEILLSLEKYKMIEKSGKKYVRLIHSLKTTMNTASHTIKCFHSENLKRAEKALFEVDLEQREFTALTFAITEKQFEEIKIELKKLRNKIAKLVSQCEEPTHVYTLANQFFPLTKEKIINNKEGE